MRQNSVFALPLFLLLAVTAAQGQEAPAGRSSDLLYAWLKDDDGIHPSFLAVIDADASSGRYGQLITTVSTEIPGEDAHHTPHTMPRGNTLPANAFRDGRTFFFDISQPYTPRLKQIFTRVEGFSYPHSFIELPSGNFLITFQSRGNGDEAPGGLLELDTDGELLRSAVADDPQVEDFIRPYSLEVFPQLDRILSTSSDMFGRQATEHLQLWQLSDLRLLSTIALPPGERRNIHQIPLEPRALGDGESAYLSTWNCGLYHVTNIAGSRPSAELVWDFGSRACAIPLKIGNHWIQAVGESWQLVVLDISDPTTPEIASVLQLPDEFEPHWIAAEPGGDRIVLTGYNALADRIVMLRFNPEQERLRIDRSFGTPDDPLPGFLTSRSIWPHGKTGPATAHAVLFWPAGEYSGSE